MMKLGRVTKVKVLFLVLVYVFDIDLFEFSAAILEKGLFSTCNKDLTNFQRFRDFFITAEFSNYL